MFPQSRRLPSSEGVNCSSQVLDNYFCFTYCMIALLYHTCSSVSVFVF